MQHAIATLYAKFNVSYYQAEEKNVNSECG